MQWISTLKELWWLAALLFGLIGAVWRTAIRTSKLKEQIDRVDTHDDKIKAIRLDTQTLKEAVGEMRSALDRHVIDQKADIQSINETLFSILDTMHEFMDSPEIKAAHQRLRKRQLER